MVVVATALPCNEGSSSFDVFSCMMGPGGLKYVPPCFLPFSSQTHPIGTGLILSQNDERCTLLVHAYQTICATVLILRTM